MVSSKRAARQELGADTWSQVALSEYTAANGATRIIPGSHLWDSERARQPNEEETIPALVPEGGVCYFISTLIHGGGQNTTSQPRQSATVQYCNPYLRPIENQILAVDPRKLDDIDSRIVDMMGYKEMRPFMGKLGNSSPRAAAQILIEIYRLRRCVEPSLWR